jgi:hypothetical protein
MFGRRKRLGHAKEMAYIVNRPARQAKRAQEALAKKPPREVPPSPPPPKRNPFMYQFRKFIPKKVRLTGPDTFGLFHQVKPANCNRNPFADGYAFCERLKKKGWTKLGSGAHSQVLAKGDSNKVIKVGCSGDSWMRYVLWGRKHGYEGNFVPRVYSYKYFKEGKFYVAVVERMENCVNRVSHEERSRVLMELLGLADRNDHAKAAMNFVEPGCGDFVNNLYKVANDNHWSMDIHGGNFMVRKNGTFVATDPINVHNDTPTERIRSRAA